MTLSPMATRAYLEARASDQPRVPIMHLAPLTVYELVAAGALTLEPDGNQFIGRLPATVELDLHRATYLEWVSGR